MNLFYDPRCLDFGSNLHPEQPARLERTSAYLMDAHPDWTWIEPVAAEEETVRRAHAEEHLVRLQQAEDFDEDTPFHDGIAEHALRAAGAAVEAVDAVLEGRGPSMALMRPPGHHATAKDAMGFCYLNNVAIAALHAREACGLARVAVWDFDAHHGNGTEAILLGRDGVLVTSVHQYPGYPNTGVVTEGNCHNWPISPGAHRREHLAALRGALACVKDFKPDLVLVSAGFDAYRGDPLTDMMLELEDFSTLGRWLRATKLPAAAMLEGGYSRELPQLVDAFLSSWAD